MERVCDWWCRSTTQYCEVIFTRPRREREQRKTNAMNHSYCTWRLLRAVNAHGPVFDRTPIQKIQSNLTESCSESIFLSESCSEFRPFFSFFLVPLSVLAKGTSLSVISPFGSPIKLYADVSKGIKRDVGTDFVTHRRVVQWLQWWISAVTGRYFSEISVRCSVLFCKNGQTARRFLDDMTGVSGKQIDFNI